MKTYYPTFKEMFDEMEVGQIFYISALSDNPSTIRFFSVIKVDRIFWNTICDSFEDATEHKAHEALWKEINILDWFEEEHSNQICNEPIQNILQMGCSCGAIKRYGT